ncbi:MAG: NADH-quinone oxidoreductase subunit NuoH [Phycisphaerae bacterium]|jgi:NADH-quinone oxidoreductase subunit H
MSEVIGHLVMIVGLLAALLTVASMLIWGERRLLALFQDRYGPNRVGPLGLGQVVADIVKILSKEDWIPPFADRAVFEIAPAVILIATMTAFAVVPFAPGLAVADINVGLLFFLAMSSMSVYSVALAGWSSNNKYALLGSMRAIGQMVSYEVFMGMSLMGVVIQAGSFRLGDIVAAQEHLWFCVPQCLGLAVFFIAGLAETRRIPYDLPEAENELVAGYHTEYSGMKFASFFLGEYVGVTLISSLVVTLFLGGWMGPLLPPVAWFLLKTFALVALFILIRGSLPRPRYDQLMSLGWKIMLPLSLANLLATGAIVLATEGGR